MSLAPLLRSKVTRVLDHLGAPTSSLRRRAHVFLTAEQTSVLDYVDECLLSEESRVARVVSFAGTGKSTTCFELFRRVIGSLHKPSSPPSCKCLYLAFNTEAAQDFMIRWLTVYSCSLQLITLHLTTYLLLPSLLDHVKLWRHPDTHSLLQGV